MNDTLCNILIVEDEEAHAELIRRAFRDLSYKYCLRVASTLAEAYAAVEERIPDLVISDMLLPDGEGIQLLPRNEPPPFPMVIMTSFGDEHVAVDAIKSGAIDYVVKTLTSLSELPHIADRALREWAHISERIRAEKALRSSEDRYRALFDNSGIALIFIEADTSISMVNLAFERLCGYTREEILDHMKWTDFVADPEQLARMLEYHYNRRKDESLAPQNYEFRLKDKYGNIKEVAVNVAMLPGTCQSLASCLDISIRKRAEEERDQLRHLLNNIIDSMPSILAGFNGHGKVNLWNSEASRRTGISAEEAIGKYVADVLPMLTIRQDLLARALTDHAVQRYDKLALQAEGESGYADVVVYPLTANEAEGAVVRIDDVTEKVRLEEMMIQTEKMMSVGGLAAGMAHEINNPLGGIIQGAQNLERRLDPNLEKNRTTAEECHTDLGQIQCYLEKRQIFEIIDGIKNSGIRASKIVTNMLRFSRSSDTVHTPQLLDRLLDKSVELASSDYDLKKNYDFRHIDIIREYDPELEAVPCAETEVEQVILNLLKNSAQAMAAMEERTEKPAITLRTYREDNMAVIEVEDNGPGMDETSRRRAFEPFYTTKPLGEGTGLGLSVSYFIITNNHHGQIFLDTNLTRGARFTIKLPLN